MKPHVISGLVLALAATPGLAAAQSKFSLAYRVERAAVTRLSLDKCLATAKAASAAVGYAPAMEKRHPGQLMVFASGPKGGNASLTVYCIAVDQKTAYVVQAMDYLRENSPEANRIADRVHQTLLAASK